MFLLPMSMKKENQRKDEVDLKVYDYERKRKIESLAISDQRRKRRL